MSALYPLPAWTTLLGFAFGAIIGSFLNVVIYRMPRAIPLGKPSKSFCPKCNHSLGVPDLFPLLSWLLSKRRCRYCGQPVIARYFWVELLNGVAWAGIWYQFLVIGTPSGMVVDYGKVVVYSLAASALIAIIFIDIELYIIPDQINAFLLFLGIGYNFYLYAQGSPTAMTWGVPSSLAGALVGVGVLWGIAFFGRLAFGKDAMGHGDIKMARGVGAILFPALAGISFGLAVFLGAVLGVVQALARKKPPGKLVQDGKIIADAGASVSSEETDENYEPETIGSLLKCGVGYLLCFDVIGLFTPKFYKSYFAEDPYAPLEDLEEFEVEQTMIPFGPYLALGAILAAIFEKQLLGGVNAYLHNVGIAPAIFLEQFKILECLRLG